MPIMCSGTGGWVPGGAPPDPEHILSGTSVVIHPASGGPADVPGLIYTDSGVSGILSIGIQWGVMSFTNLRIHFVHCYMQDMILIGGLS